MALLVLTFMGALLGWIATIIARIEDRGGVLTHVGIGAVVAVISGILANSGSFIGGLSALACIAALVSASAVLAGFVYVRERRISE
ncbi:hypothetical protein ACRAQ6_04595 [Erythrobacter sp. HA6-11]